MEIKVTETEHNIDHEQKLVELLGYHLIGPDKSNRWKIIDEHNKQVGFIQYKKVINKNVKRGYPATFGYHTVIDSPKIFYEYTRKIDNIESNNLIADKYSYNFNLKREDGVVNRVHISMNEFPSLRIFDKNAPFIEFKVGSDGLYLNFQSKTENFNVEEIVIFKNPLESDSVYEKEYVYQIRYCKKPQELSDDNFTGITIKEICGSWNQLYQDSDKLQLALRTWIHGKLRNDRRWEVLGTVEEMATKHKMGINSFKHFRFLVNQLLPFNQEVISVMLSDDVIREYGLSIFVPDLVKKSVGRAPSLVKKNEDENKDNV